MLAYRHLFHAGNFADVFKHAVLTRLFLHLNKKDKPYFYLDTHAGIGSYDLAHDWARKNAEFQAGIARIFGARQAPEEMKDYLKLVHALNPDGKLRYYPGSPWIARALLRPGDRLVFNELNKEDCTQLQSRFEGDRQVHVHALDGYQALKAFLPPPERRGLVLIDSAFDRAQEYKRLAEAVIGAHQRWSSGMFALWYPLMDWRDVESFEQRFVHGGIRKILKLSLSVLPENWTGGLRGSALLVINPPWGLDDEARRILPWLWTQLATDRQGGKGEGSSEVEWLVPE